MRGSRLPLLILALAACGGGAAMDPNAPLPTYDDQDRGVTFVNSDDLHAWIEAGHADDVVFVDNRIQIAWEEKRVEGARLIPTDRMAEEIGTLPVNKWLVLYCT